MAKAKKPGRIEDEDEFEDEDDLGTRRQTVEVAWRRQLLIGSGWKLSTLLTCIVYTHPGSMRYLVKARLKTGREKDLLHAIHDQSLGLGSVAGDEYLDDMERARLAIDGTVHWVEVCFCRTPLAEERPYWEEYFQLLSVNDAHARRNCRDWNGTEPWACCDCDCTRKLEAKLECRGQSFVESLKLLHTSARS